MDTVPILISLLVTCVTAQSPDTYHCPDGWMLEESHGGCQCFLISADEAVTKEDAEVLCAFHDGAWVAELSNPG